MDNDNIKNMNTVNMKIRYEKDEKTSVFYYSIIDIINKLKLSTDPRNYWKVLKNRLKNTHNELVTECNQLKMIASDNKYYLTDVGTSHNLLQIIQIIAPEKVAYFEELFNNIESSEEKNIGYNFFGDNQKKISTVSVNSKKIKLDMYKIESNIYITSMIEGVLQNNIFVSLNTNTLTIKFNRQLPDDKSILNYKFQELSWGNFSRIISLPYEVDIDRVETKFSNGLLFIQLSILDKTRTKIISIK